MTLLSGVDEENGDTQQQLSASTRDRPTRRNLSHLPTSFALQNLALSTGAFFMPVCYAAAIETRTSLPLAHGRYLPKVFLSDADY